jgi:hypothetical protein
LLNHAVNVHPDMAACGTQAAAALWRLLVGRTQLGAHLAALRKYFLLGAGDFWHTFLMQVVACDPATS